MADPFPSHGLEQLRFKFEYFDINPYEKMREIIPQDEVLLGTVDRNYVQPIQEVGEYNERSRRQIQRDYKLVGSSLLRWYPLLVVAVPVERGAPLDKIEVAEGGDKPQTKYELFLYDGHHRRRYAPTSPAFQNMPAAFVSVAQMTKLYNESDFFGKSARKLTPEELVELLKTWNAEAVLSMAERGIDAGNQVSVYFDRGPNQQAIPYPVAA